MCPAATPAGVVGLRRYRAHTRVSVRRVSAPGEDPNCHVLRDNCRVGKVFRGGRWLVAAGRRWGGGRTGGGARGGACLVGRDWHGEFHAPSPPAAPWPAFLVRVRRSGDVELSRRAAGRRGGRLPRDAGGGSVPVAGGDRGPRDPRLDRGAAGADRGRAGADAGARGDPRPADRAVEHPPLQPAGEARRPLFLRQERRAAEPVGAVRAGHAGQPAAGAARPEHALGRRHGGARADRAPPATAAGWATR